MPVLGTVAIVFVIYLIYRYKRARLATKSQAPQDPQRNDREGLPQQNPATVSPSLINGVVTGPNSVVTKEVVAVAEMPSPQELPTQG